MRREPLLHPTEAGLYCPAGGFHIDPLRPVDRALITHAHADHARAGHRHVLASAETLEIMALRLGEGFAGATQVADGEMQIGGVRDGLVEVTQGLKPGDRIVVEGTVKLRDGATIHDVAAKQGAVPAATGP